MVTWKTTTIHDKKYIINKNTSSLKYLEEASADLEEVVESSVVADCLCQYFHLINYRGIFFISFLIVFPRFSNPLLCRFDYISPL